MKKVVTQSYESLPLHQACLDNNLQEVHTILEGKQVSINLQSPKGQTPLYLACEAGHLELVQFLMSVPDIDPNLTTINRLFEDTPLCIAYLKGHTEIVKFLLIQKNVDLLKVTFRLNNWMPFIGLLLLKDNDSTPELFEFLIVYHPSQLTAIVLNNIAFIDYINNHAEEKIRNLMLQLFENPFVIFNSEQQKTILKFNHPQIRELLNKQENLFAEHQAALLVLFTVLLNDGYLKLTESDDKKIHQFFRITQSLPLDLLLEFKPILTKKDGMIHTTAINAMVGFWMKREKTIDNGQSNMDQQSIAPFWNQPL